MTNLLDMRYPGAQRAYLAANSSSYFLRKLREDTDVQRAGALYSADEMVAAIKEAIGRPPSGVDELVVPYALLAALAIRGPRARLEEVAAIPSPHHEWFQDLARKLIESWKSTLVTKVTVALPQMRVGTGEISSNTTSAVRLIIPGQQR